MSRCPTCGRFPIDIEHRAKEWSDDLNENKSLVKDNAALRVDLAAALAQLAEKGAEAKRLREAVEWAIGVVDKMEKNGIMTDYDLDPWRELRAELRRRAGGEGREGMKP